MTWSRSGPILVGSLIAAGVLLLSGCASHAPHSAAGPTTAERVAAAPERTAVYAFHAFAADGRPAVTIAHTAKGYCWNSSLATSSRDAFRCFSGNTILDPCFVPSTPNPTTLVCLPDPWSKAILLHLTRTLPTSDASGAIRPWALQLATGARCVASTGTVPAVGGVSLNYHCDNGTSAQIADAKARTMTADYATPTAKALHRTPIVAVWST